ncbi:MAG: hypothetical protein NT040_12660 [Bacteroidetes bacterium]|nr:hypothetical protein [Bacteroidota bacterium]
MRWNIFLSLFIFITINELKAQDHQFYIPDYVNFDADSVLKEKIYSNLNTLFGSINGDIRSCRLVNNGNYSQNIEFFECLKGLEASKKYNATDFYKKQLINAYRILPNKYLLNIAYVGYADGCPIINNICTIIVDEENDTIKFSSPLEYRTTEWKSKQVGNILYHYKNEFNIEVAVKFEASSRYIASNLGLTPLDLIFYKCDNFQEAFRIIGFEYDLSYNGKYKESWILGNTIFQGFNNEKISHDIFHVYTAKMIDTRDRNWTAEEGIAYSWGDAYYPKQNGEIISRNELAQILKDTVNKTPDIDLLKLFETRSDIYDGLSPNVKVKSVMSSLICDEVQKQKGNKGIIELIKCGKGDANFFITIDKLIGINRGNFNKKVKELIERYK